MMNDPMEQIPELFRPLYGPIEQNAEAAVAVRARHEFEPLAAPEAACWQHVPCLVFENDWQGRNADDQRRTAVRLQWTPETLYLRFDCRYRDLHVYADGAQPDGRRYELWMRDVVEAFIQADAQRPRFYREFEISPNGQWLELDIFPGGNDPDWSSGWRRAVQVHRELHLWTAEAAIPMGAFDAQLDPRRDWRVNFFRVEGEPQAFHSWQATETPQPNFHVPAAFAPLRFEG